MTLTDPAFLNFVRLQTCFVNGDGNLWCYSLLFESALRLSIPTMEPVTLSRELKDTLKSRHLQFVFILCFTRSLIEFLGKKNKFGGSIDNPFLFFLHSTSFEFIIKVMATTNTPFTAIELLGVVLTAKIRFTLYNQHRVRV